MAIKETRPKVLGLSHDGRTNRWEVTCPACKKPFEPVTTLRSVQQLTCRNPRCGQELFADYNAEPPTVRLLLDVH